MDETLEAKRHFAEEVGLFFEQSGVPRMAGRVLGWLLICEPPEQSAPDLMAALQASAGSISSATQFLTRLGMVERRSLPGKRRDHFRIRDGLWVDLIASRWSSLGAFRRLADRGLALLDGAPSAARGRLQEARDLYAFFERELPALLDRWEKERLGNVETLER